ncbi:SPASM domain-containing protein, partial [Desulfobotulus sp. H1]
LVSFFDVHNWGGAEKKSTGSGQDKLGRLNILSDLSQKTKLICPDLLLRFIVFLSGDVALCCGDEKAVHSLGNIFENDPIEIYNGSVFSDYRRLMGEGRLTDIAYCRNCQIILSRMKKQYLEVTGKF